MKNLPSDVSPTVLNFDVLPDSVLAGTREYKALTGRSRASFYRDAENGLITLIRIGGSVRGRLGDIRRLLGCPAPQLSA